MLGQTPLWELSSTATGRKIRACQCDAGLRFVGVSSDDTESCLSSQPRSYPQKGTYTERALVEPRASLGHAVFLSGLQSAVDDVALVPYSRHLSRITHGHARLVHTLQGFVVDNSQRYHKTHSHGP